MKSNFPSLSPFLIPFFGCQLGRFDSVQFLCSRSRIPAGWHVETQLFTPRCWTSSNQKSLYDWRFITNQFVLVSSPLRLTTRHFFPNSTIEVLVLMQHPHWREVGLVCYEYAWPFVKCKCRACSMLLNNSSFCTIHKSSVSTGFGKQICLSYIFYATSAA
jgi:hypothetical protein